MTIVLYSLKVKHVSIAYICIGLRPYFGFRSVSNKTRHNKFLCLKTHFAHLGHIIVLSYCRPVLVPSDRVSRSMVNTISNLIERTTGINMTPYIEYIVRCKLPIPPFLLLFIYRYWNEVELELNVLFQYDNSAQPLIAFIYIYIYQCQSLFKRDEIGKLYHWMRKNIDTVKGHLLCWMICNTV